MRVQADPDRLCREKIEFYVKNILQVSSMYLVKQISHVRYVQQPFLKAGIQVYL
jgi:hypothetical protein